MKKILAIAIAASVLFSLDSCRKEETESTPETVRVMTGAFSNDETTDDDTKTTLDTDSKTPLWSVGDMIRVLDGTSYEDITLAAGDIKDGGKKITFTTTLTGAMLYAVYPASATTMTSCSDGNINFTIPTIQDGTFGSANICVASGDGSTPNTIYFSNATAVVEMKLADGVVYANLTAANKMAGDMSVAIGNKGAISSTTTSALSSNYIFVSDSPSDSIYLAVAPVDAGTVTVTCNTSTKSGSEGKGTKTLVRDKIYAMDLSGMTISTDDLTGQHGVLNGQEYVIIKGSDSKYLKWATQNLAVTASGKAKWNSTNYVIGDYFQWAAYDGYVYTSFTNDGSSGSFSGWKNDKKFNQASAPYYNGSSYTKYTSGPATLESSDDVASIVLGGTWRMPTGGSGGQFNAMKEATYWAWDGSTDKGYYVFKPGVGTSGAADGRGDIAGTDDKTKALLFFPAAGRGKKTELGDAGVKGFYWSSTLDSANTEDAGRLYFTSSSVSPGSTLSRYYGFSVRPVSE